MTSLTSGLIVVHVDALQLQVGVTVVTSRWIDAVFVRDDFPELKHNSHIPKCAVFTGLLITHESYQTQFIN